MPSIVWRGQLTFGLVSIPVKLLRAARKERVKLQYLHRAAAPQPAETAPDEADSEDFPAPTGIGGQAPAREPSHWQEPDEEPEPSPAPLDRVRQTFVSESAHQPVSRSEVVKGYEVEPNRYVVLDQAEIRGLQRRTSPTMEIVRSVQLAEIDPVFFETSYYVVPDKGGEKSYSLLFAALRSTGHVALAKVGMYGREHVIIVRPGLHGMMAHSMFYTDEIRFDNEFHADVSAVGGKELELATAFLKALEAPFAPEEFKDLYREELQNLIAKKAARMQPAAAPAPTAPAATPPVEILEALKRSLALKRKPPASESEPPKAPSKSGRKTRRKAG
jgi:DNA end-binding protein Ku